MKRFAPVSAALIALLASSQVLATTYSASGLIDTSGSNPFAACTADDVAGQIEMFGSTLYPNAEVEPWLDVNPTNSQNMIGAYQQDRWNDGASRGDIAAVTTDGGATWVHRTLPGTTQCAGGPFPRGTDPWVSFGPTGIAWYVTQTVDFATGATGMVVNKSTDGGLTWGQGVNVSPIVSSPPRFPFDDKVSITADPGDADNVYVIWDRGLIPFSFAKEHNEHFRFWGFKQPTMMSRTTDGGQTWSEPRVVYDPGANNFTLFSQIVVLPDGTLVDMLFEFLTKKNNDGGGKFEGQTTVVRSKDRGVHWSQPIRIARQVPAFLLDTQTPQRVGEPGQAIAVDRNPTSPGYGNLYAVWLDGRFSDTTFGDIAFSRSTDGGLTWSDPSRANLTPRGHSAFTPTVAVADGTVGVGYYDERNYGGDTDPLGPLTTDLWMSHCHAACTSTANWSETHVAGPFDQNQAAVAGGLFLGDYAGLATSGNIFHPYYALAIDRATNPSDVFFANVGP
jgi:hypothetical protein